MNLLKNLINTWFGTKPLPAPVTPEEKPVSKVTQKKESSIPQEEPKEKDQEEKSLVLSGRDEMNLIEFPFATLRNRGDSRKAITYEGWTTDKEGNRLQQKWTVAGSSTLGLPNEFAERVYVALMAITAQQGLESRKTAFSVYEVLKVMGLPDTKQEYQYVEKALDQLRGVNIKAEGAFWDNEKKELIRTATGFGLIDEYWLRYQEKDEKIIEKEGVPAYILWSDRIWKSIKGGYVKSLDTSFYYGLETPLARRLYRLLDKRMFDKTTYDFDIFDLAAKLGMARYRRPGDVTSKLKPAIEELISSGFLTSATPVKVQGYSRIRFIKGSGVPTPTVPTGVVSAPAIKPPTSKEPHEALRGGLVLDLVAIGVNPQTAQDLIKTYPSELIEKWLDALATMQEQGKSKQNPAGFLIHVLKTSTPPPTGAKTKAQKEQEQKALEDRRKQLDAQMAAYEEQERIRREEEQSRQHELVAQLQARYETSEDELMMWSILVEDVKTKEEFIDLRLVLPSAHFLSLKQGIALLAVTGQWQEKQIREHDHLIKQAFKSLGYDVKRIAFENPRNMP